MSHFLLYKGPSIFVYPMQFDKSNNYWVITDLNIDMNEILKFVHHQMLDIEVIISCINVLYIRWNIKPFIMNKIKS